MRAQLPAGWTANRAVLDAGGPWSANNFANRYLRGGLIPVAGCEIEGVAASPDMPRVPELIRKEIPGASSVEPATINGFPGYRVSYLEDYGPTARYQSVAVYISAPRVYKLFLTYRAGDSAESGCLAAFEKTLASFQPAQ